MLIYLTSLIILLVLLYAMDSYHTNKFKSLFPKNIISDLDETIQLPETEKSKTIPKVIYRTHKKEKIKDYQQSIDFTQKHNPGFKQVIYDNEMCDQFIKDKFSDRIYQAYQSINPSYGPAKSDFFRTLIIYYYGGIYLDIKSVGTSLEELAKTDKLVACLGRGKPYINSFHFNPYSLFSDNYNWYYFSDIEEGEINNWCISAPPGNYVLGKMIQQMVSNIEYGKKHMNEYNNGQYSVLAMTGPICYSKIISKYKTDSNVKILSKYEKQKYFKYELFDHKALEGNKHYSKNKDKNILIKT